MIGVRRHEGVAPVAAELGVGLAACAATENGNALYWDEAVAARLAGGPVLPPTTLATWARPLAWAPGIGSGAGTWAAGTR